MSRTNMRIAPPGHVGTVGADGWCWDKSPGWEGHAWCGRLGVCVRNGIVRTVGDVPLEIVREAIRRGEAVDL